MSGYSGLIQAIKKAKEEKKTEIKIEDRFLHEFNETLKVIEMERAQPIPTEYLRPSMMYGCVRMLWAARRGIKPDEGTLDPILIGIQESGTDRHERIQEVVSKMPNIEMLDVEAQVKQANLMGINTEFVNWDSSGYEARCLNKDLGIFFKPDGVIRYFDYKCILEIKTESIYKFSKRFYIEPKHKIQATCYAMGLGLDYVLFLYEDRNFTQKKIYLWKVEDEIKEEIFHKVETVNNYLSVDEVPPKEESKEACQYCSFKTFCKEEG